MCRWLRCLLLAACLGRPLAASAQEPVADPQEAADSPAPVADGAATPMATPEEAPAEVAEADEAPSDGRLEPAATGAPPSPEEATEAAAAPAPCLAPPVVLTRRHGRLRERLELSLTLCDGSPNPEAVLPLSLMARPYRSPRPTPEEVAATADQGETGFVAPGVRRQDPGLLTRLQHLASAFPGHEITVVSGHRPHANRTSKHRLGRALDVRIEGVAREDVVEAARVLDGTGVGYYPNSTFTHIDVRPHQTYWVDRSRPGQPADYGPWPRPPEEEERLRRDALAALREATEVFDTVAGALRDGEPAAEPVADAAGATDAEDASVGEEVVGGDAAQVDEAGGTGDDDDAPSDEAEPAGSVSASETRATERPAGEPASEA